MRTGTANQIEIILIRHSYTRMNEEHRYIGRTDEKLSERGISLAMTKKQQTDEPVFSGPMERCVETAENMFPESEIIEIPEWTEIDFGDFEGKNYQELNGNADYQRWIDSGGSIAFPNGESREAFIERSMQGLENMIEYAREKICQIYAVLHGGNIMAIMYTLLGGQYFDYQVKPAEGYRLLVDVSEQIKVIEYEEWK
ncbi:MAG: histidine phosphatase family protein [Agathobacter sp.]|nr:histidine phosphatase family protein [Agathobacter sp.]